MTYRENKLIWRTHFFNKKKNPTRHNKDNERLSISWIRWVLSYLKSIRIRSCVLLWIKLYWDVWIVIPALWNLKNSAVVFITIIYYKARTSRSWFLIIPRGFYFKSLYKIIYFYSCFTKFTIHKWPYLHVAR